MKFLFLALSISLSISAFADELVVSMARCGWDFYSQNIQKFQQHRKLLPPQITVAFKSCSAAGPTYRVKSKNKTVIIQDGWFEGDSYTANYFSINQPNSDFWQFEYQGYEWGGYQWIHQVTGKITSSSGNFCYGIQYSSTRKKAILFCEPEYASSTIDIYAVTFDGAIKLTRIQKNLPFGDIAVKWDQNSDGQVTLSQRDNKWSRRHRLR